MHLPHAPSAPAAAADASALWPPVKKALLAALPLLLLMAATLAAPASAGQLEQMRATREIAIAHRDASVPFSYANADGKPVGYAVDICLRIADALKKELGLPSLAVRWVPVTSATRVAAIAEGKAAMECGSTTHTAERRKSVDYTIAHFIAASRFLVRADSNIDNLAGLAGKTVVSTLGTTNLPTLRRLNNEQLLRMNVLEARDHREAFAMVEAGTADAFAMDDVLLSGLRANAPEPKRYKVVGKPMTIEPYAIVLPKGDAAFKQAVDREMRRLIASGEIHAIYQRWFEQPIPPNGIQLGLPMSAMLKDSFRFPSDKVGDLLN